MVNKQSSLINALSSSFNFKALTGKASFKCGRSLLSSRSICALAVLSPPFAIRPRRLIAFSTLSKSASASSVLMTSISACGSTRFET